MDSRLRGNDMVLIQMGAGQGPARRRPFTVHFIEIHRALNPALVGAAIRA
jgi:hypothetical protein